MQSLGKDEFDIREDSSLAVLRGRTLPVIWTKWTYPATCRDDAKVFLFVCLCTILYLEYVLIFSLIAMMY